MPGKERFPVPRMNPSSQEAELLHFILVTCGEITGRALISDDRAPDRGFHLLGIDSVSVFRLQLDLENRLGIALPDEFLVQNPTPRKAAAALARRSDEERT